MKRIRKNWLVPLVLIAMICGLAFAAPKPAAADNGFLVATLVPTSVVVVGGAAYLLYKNRLSQPPEAKGRLGYHGPGEFFIGGFFGGAFVTNDEWVYQIGSQSITARKMSIDPGVMGGIKLGYFLDSVPYLGIEAEGSIGNHPQPSQTVSLKPAFAGSAAGRVPSQTILDWTMAFHFVGRYGFLPDKEVPFGRLQPYIGIGPGVVVLYAEDDSAKNFSLEIEAGLRYMFTKHLGGFIEYKYSKQWSVELELQKLIVNNTRSFGNANFDFDRHQVVVGLAYHF